MYHRFSTTKINKVILCFAEDITATATAKKVEVLWYSLLLILGVKRNTVNRDFYNTRKIFKEKGTEKKIEAFELGESYFEAKRVRGKRLRSCRKK